MVMVCKNAHAITHCSRYLAMPVYVDDMKASYGPMIMCHCWADSRDELFAMMRKIGVDLKWFQQPPKASWEHFDIAMSKRRLAVQHGAIETDRYGPLIHTAMLDIRSGDTALIKRGFNRLVLALDARTDHDDGAEL